MREIEIFHPENGSINIKGLKTTFKSVGKLNIPKGKHFFYFVQNMHPNYSKLGVRSTCVGDIVKVEEQFLLIKGTGVKTIQKKDIKFKNSSLI